MAALHVCSSSPVFVKEMLSFIQKVIILSILQVKKMEAQKVYPAQGHIIVQSAEQELKHMSIGFISQRPWCKRFRPGAPAALSLGAAKRELTPGALLRGLRPEEACPSPYPRGHPSTSSDQRSGYFSFCFQATCSFLKTEV